MKLLEDIAMHTGESRPLADEGPGRLCAADEIVRLWNTCAAFDLDIRRQLLTRALAAGRPLGMRSWARDCEHDTPYSGILMLDN